MKDRLAVAVGLEVKKEAMKMAQALGVTISSMGDLIFTTFGKTQFEEFSKHVRILENAEVQPGEEREAALMIDRLKRSREAYRRLAEIYDEIGDEQLVEYEEEGPAKDTKPHTRRKGGK